MRTMLLALLGIFMPVLLPAQEYYLAHWVWDSTNLTWVAPHSSEGLLDSIDLRSNTDCGTPVTPNGYGLFAYSAPIVDVSMIDLGSDLNAVSVSLTKTTLQTLLNLPRSLQSNTLSGEIIEIFTTLSDPTGISGVKPMMPDHRGNIKLSIGGVKLMSKHIVPFKSPEWANILKTMQYDYAQIPDVQTRRKVLGYWMNQYNIRDEKVLLAKGVKDDGWSVPATQIFENWNCADTTQSLNCNNTWTLVVKDSFGIYSGQASSSGTAAVKIARLQRDVSSSNMTTTVDISSFGVAAGQQQYCGPATRYQAGANTMYEVSIDHEAGGSINVRLEKIVTGTQTVLDVIKPTTLGTLPGKLMIYANGSNIQTFWNGVQYHNITDTSVSVGTRGGLVFKDGSSSFAGDMKMDNLNVKDFKAKGWIIQ